MTNCQQIRKQSKFVMNKIREKELDEMCSQMSDEELELVIKSLLKSKSQLS